MNIIFTNKELDKREIYKHTRASGVSIKDCEDGAIIVPAEVCIYEDVNNNGEVVTITSIIDKDGKHYVTNSKFFREELQYIIDLMGGEEYGLIVRKQKSKGGRTFVTCEMN